MKLRQSFSRLVPVLLSLLVVSVLFAGCAVGDASSEASTHTVTFWTSDTAVIDTKAYNDIVTAFEKANPGIHVRLVGQPTQAQGDNSSIVTAVRGGQPPDVYLTDRFTVNQQAATGLLTDLSPYIQKDDPNLSQNYFPYAWNEVKYRNGIYGLPMDTDARALFYNKDLFRQAGIDPSIMDPSHGPLTITELQQIASKLNKTDAHGNYTQLGILPWIDEGYALTWALDYGANFYNNATCQITPAEPAMVKALTLIQNWAKQIGMQKASEFQGAYMPANAPPSQAPFYTGHLAMQLSGPWNVQGIQEYAPKLNYGITYLPVTHAGQKPFTWSGGYGLVMPYGAPNPDDAYKFMKFMTGPAGQTIYTKETGHLATWAALNNDPQLVNGNVNFFVNLLQYSESRPPLPASASLWAALLTAQQGVTISDESPQQAAQAAEQQVQPDMQQYCPYKMQWQRPA